MFLELEFNMSSGKIRSKYSYWQNLSVSPVRTDKALYASLALHKAFNLIRVTTVYNTIYLDYLKRYPLKTVSELRTLSGCDLKCVLDEVWELVRHLKFK